MVVRLFLGVVLLLALLLGVAGSPGSFSLDGVSLTEMLLLFFAAALFGVVKDLDLCTALGV